MGPADKTRIRLIEFLKRELPPSLAEGTEKPLGMDLTVPRARTLPMMTIIHQKTVQAGINKSVTDRLF